MYVRQFSAGAMTTSHNPTSTRTNAKTSGNVTVTVTTGARKGGSLRRLNGWQMYVKAWGHTRLPFSELAHFYRMGVTPYGVRL